MKNIYSYFSERFWGTTTTNTPLQEDKVEERAEDRHARRNQVDVQDQIKSMRVKQKHLEYQADNHEKLARDLFKKGKKGDAANALKRSKVIRAQAQQLSGQIANLEQTQMTLDAAVTNTDMFHIMQATRTTIRAQMSGLNVDDVEELKGDLQDATEDMQDITRVFSTPIYQTNMDEEDEIMEQMAEWEEESNMQENDKVEKLLPEIPSHKVGSGNNDDNNNNNDNDRVELRE